MQFKEYRLIVDRRHSDRSLIHIGHFAENSAVSRMITKLIGMVDSVTSQLQTQPGRDTFQKDNSEHPNQDIMMKNETMREMTLSEQAEISDITDNTAPGTVLPEMNLTEMDHQSEDGSGMEQPAISDLAAIAGEFNAAFNTALYELDSSRKQLVERSIRIDELNESIKTINNALNDETNKGRRKEEEYSREAEQLNKKINNIESDREHLLQQANEQENTLNARAEEISQLSSRVKEVTETLEQRTAEGQHAQEAFVRARDILTNKLDELQIQFNEAGSQLKAQQKALEDRDNEISGINRQIDSLTTELDSMVEASVHEKDAHNQEVARLGTAIQDLNENLQTSDQQLEQRREELELKGKETEWLNNYVAELKDEIDAKSESMRAQSESHASTCDELNGHINQLKEEVEAQSESMRTQSESHASTCDDLNAQINNISGELESLHAAHNDLVTHAENLENLNRALHESSISEKTLHKKLMAEKINKVESLQTRLGSANESQNGPPENTEANKNLQIALNDLESRLQETEAQNLMLGERAKLADELEAEAGQLRTTLQESREADSADAQSLQGQLADLNSALENSRAEQDALAAKLRDHEALEQEVMSLREAQQQADNTLLEQVDVGNTVDSLKAEIEKLKSALSASEVNNVQLLSSLPGDSPSDDPGVSDTPAPVQDSQSVSKIADREQFASHLNTLLAEQTGSDTNRTVMYVLLDNFIRIRDEIGVMNSEHVISRISEIIESFCTNDEIISRFGDCTFAILSSNESTDETRQKAEKICTTIEQHIFEVSEHSMIVTTSIGICKIRENDACAEDVISRADLACEAARSSGGNQVLVSSAIADEVILMGSNENHEKLVSATLNENRIMIYYQPISNLKDVPGNYYEALVRIVDESGNIILPGEFFSMAAVSGQTVDIDRYVIDKIMQMLAENPDKGMSLFIKLTKQSVADHELPLWIIGKIKEYKINSEQLVFEIAETTLQSDLKNLSMLSKALNSIGCKIAIEHYRMSTQTQHLLHIHTDYLKIDSGLVESLSRKGGSLEKVTAIMDIARKNNYTTIAEGVEDPACLAILWELGVSLAQGYFIQAPTGNRDYDFQGSESEGETENSNKAKFATT
jgi:diguanylate cyclase (GGDEF)-like protein